MIIRVKGIVSPEYSTFDIGTFCSCAFGFEMFQNAYISRHLNTKFFPSFYEITYPFWKSFLWPSHPKVIVHWKLRYCLSVCNLKGQGLLLYDWILENISQFRYFRPISALIFHITFKRFWTWKRFYWDIGSANTWWPLMNTDQWQGRKLQREIEKSLN